MSVMSCVSIGVRVRLFGSLLSSRGRRATRSLNMASTVCWVVQSSFFMSMIFMSFSFMIVYLEMRFCDGERWCDTCGQGLKQ